jgi:hypothetical protein
MLKPEYHERIERAMWLRSSDKRLPAWKRWHIRKQAIRFRLLTKMASDKQADGEPTEWLIDHLKKCWACSRDDAWRIVLGGECRTKDTQK